jgi:hypothetical protein
MAWRPAAERRRPPASVAWRLRFARIRCGRRDQSEFVEPRPVVKRHSVALSRYGKSRLAGARYLVGPLPAWLR